MCECVGVCECVWVFVCSVCVCVCVSALTLILSLIYISPLPCLYISCLHNTGGVQQLEALSSLLQQTQQLQQLQAIQHRLANGQEEGNVGGAPAQLSNVEPMVHEGQQPIFNKVHIHVCMCIYKNIHVHVHCNYTVHVHCIYTCRKLILLYVCTM